jgi:hypothetical protein
MDAFKADGAFGEAICGVDPKVAVFIAFNN